MELKKEELIAIINIMNRADIKGAEAIAVAMLIQKIQQLTQKEDKVEQK